MATTDKKIKLALILMAVSCSNLSYAQITPQEMDALQKNTLEQSLSEEASSFPQEKNGMVWSLMPGESVNRLATLFYPKNRSMQQLFVAKTLYLSRNIQPGLRAGSTSSQLTLVVIPDIRQLSQQSIKLAASKNYNGEIRQPQAKPQMLNAISPIAALGINPKIQIIYDELIKKNEFLKLEINKINAKLAYLEQVFVTLKTEIIRLAGSVSENVDAKLNTQPNAEVVFNQQPLAEAGSVQQIQASQLSNNLVQSQESTIVESKPATVPALSTKSVQVKPSFDTSYLFLTIFNLILVIACLVGFVLFNRQQVKNRALATNGKFKMTKSDEIRKKSLMIKDKLEIQKKIKMLKVNAPVVLGEFKHSMPCADVEPEASPVVGTQMSAEISTEATPNTSPKINLTVSPVVDTKVIAEVTPSAKAVDNAYDKEEAELLLGQAKVFVQVDRAGYAIRLLKAQIQAAPKTSLQHWLYLLDIYRETNQKEAFLEHAKQLHQNFNVMMPLWENTPPKMVIASSLEEFSHITAKVTKLWADCIKEANSITQTKAYLDELLTDNRDSQRSGFSMEVFQEIMTLRNLLDEREKQTEEEMEAY